MSGPGLLKCFSRLEILRISILKDEKDLLLFQQLASGFSLPLSFPTVPFWFIHSESHLNKYQGKGFLEDWRRARNKWEKKNLIPLLWFFVIPGSCPWQNHTATKWWNVHSNQTSVSCSLPNSQLFGLISACPPCLLSCFEFFLSACCVLCTVLDSGVIAVTKADVCLTYVNHEACILWSRHHSAPATTLLPTISVPVSFYHNSYWVALELSLVYLLLSLDCEIF